uniref:Uncharacterized protein n=1 Tax=Rhizophora mucronata TaxID=61149 RepID=A0A2P2IXZ5_RHIMU
MHNHKAENFEAHKMFEIKESQSPSPLCQDQELKIRS